MPLKIQTRDPQHLKALHPALRLVPELAEGSEEYLGLCEGLKKAGFIRPILVDEQDRVIDDHGRNLARAARRWQLKVVPVQVCSSADAPLLLLHSLAHVRHLSKSAIAYLAVPQLEEAFKAARVVMLEKLRKNPENVGVHSVDSLPQTWQEMGEELGISRSLLGMAKKVHDAFNDTSKKQFTVKGGPQDGDAVECTLKEWFEPKLLAHFIGSEHEQNRPLGLSGLLSAIGSKKLDPNTFDPKNKGQMDFLAGLFTDIKRFTALTDAKREAAINQIEKQAEEMSPEECQQTAASLKAMAKIYENAAKSKA